MSETNSAAVRSNRFAVSPFAPDGGADPGGVLMLVGTLALAGAVLGFVAHFIAQWFYLILIFPLGIGIGLGLLGGLMVKRGNVRNPWLGGIAGFLGGVFAMTLMHYFDYQTYRDALIARVPEVKELAALSSTELEKNVRENYDDPDEVLAAVRGAQSLPGYLNMAAIDGVKIGKAGRSDKPLNLGYYGSYIYWIIEVLIVAGITLFMVRDEARAPYCRPCSLWKTTAALGGFDGDVAMAKTGVSSGDVDSIAAAKPALDRGGTILFKAVCPNCNAGVSTVDLKLVQFVPQQKGKPKETVLAHSSWPGDSLPTIDALFAPKPQEVVVPPPPPPPLPT